MSKIVLSNARLFGAALFCQSHELSRPYINGVRLEPSTDGGILVTSTDGHRLFHGHDYSGSCVETFQPVTIKACKKTLPTAWFKGNNPLEIDLDQLVMRCGTQVMWFSLVVDAYPDYNRVLPAMPVSGEIAQFNAKYLEDFRKMGEILEAGKTTNFAIGHNGGSPAVIRWNGVDNAFGVLMPFRCPWFDPVIPELPKTLNVEES